jgi:acyl-CoA reductase-like NAD-dependent aldehyde dehydrogenase
MTSAKPPPVAATLDASFARLRSGADGDPYPSHAVRDRRLAMLEQLLRDHADDFLCAISSDFGHRSSHETQLYEIVPSFEAIRFARRHLKAWMAPETRKTSRWFMTASASVHYEPLGLIGIVVPWNYPLYLAFAPLVAALAAGNRALLKLSELAPQTAELMQRLFAEAVEGVVAAVGGDSEVGRVRAPAVRSSAFHRLDPRWPRNPADGRRAPDAGDT